MQEYALKHELGDVVKDRYTIRQVLGAGAFGTVYRVEEQIGARIISLACKEMHVLSDPATQLDERADALRMFQEEAYILQTLRHPNIPAAYFEQDKGVWLACPMCGKTFRGMRNCPDHGSALEVVKERYYLIMDFIEGPDLEEMLVANGRPLEENAVLDWALQLCDALETVHSKGLSHRDIKPANIKIQKDTSRAMLIDFGLVKPSGAVGGFGTVLKSKSTGMGTLGYAPESQHEQSHPDARTDILAFGMTLYRLFTRRDPTEPDDLALMRRTTPGNLNLNLSPAVDEIILRAIKSNPDDRYPNVAALRNDLRAARYPVEVTCPSCDFPQRSALRPTADSVCERCGRPLLASKKTTSAKAPPPTPVPVTRPNPFEPRIRQIQQERVNSSSAPPFLHEARIAELEAKLAEVGRQSVGQSTKCPACRQHDMTQVSGQPTGRCPLCDGTQLMRRQWETNRCAVCREGELREHLLHGNETFCPVCRAAKLVEEDRRKFGVIIDVWSVCPHCKAEFDVQMGGRSRLERYKDDPFGVGATHSGQALPVTEWKALSQRSAHFWNCTACEAQWDVLPDARWKLAHFGRDPHGVGKRYDETALTRIDWSKLANGLPLESGNLHCPQCEGEFDYDRDDKTLYLHSVGKLSPKWASGFVGRSVPLQDYYFAASGKQSPHPGWICPQCKTEFNSQSNGLSLVQSFSPALEASKGTVLSLQDWQRRGQGLPVGAEAGQLRGELQRLLAQRQQEQTQFQLSQRQRRAGLEGEFLDLLKQSVLGGFIPIQRVSTYSQQPNDPNGISLAIKGSAKRTQLRSSELVLWESPARLCTVRLERNLAAWHRAAAGTLVVTNERVLFNPTGPDARLWQTSLTKIETISMQHVQQVPVVVLKMLGGDEPIGFEVSQVSWDIVVDGKNYALTFQPHELATLLMQQINL
ncbi:MAG TPA: protein kinase [Abditibacteriaceae bacterium]